MDPEMLQIAVDSARSASANVKTNSDFVTEEFVFTDLGRIEAAIERANAGKGDARLAAAMEGVSTVREILTGYRDDRESFYAFLQGSEFSSRITDAASAERELFAMILIDPIADILEAVMPPMAVAA